MSWKRLAKVPLIIVANGWSWLTYLLTNFPPDKAMYKQNAWNWLSKEMEPHWLELEKPNSRTFHELKNVGVEYARAHSQPAMKSLCMFLVLGWVLWVISTLALVLSLLF